MQKQDPCRCGYLRRGHTGAGRTLSPMTGVPTGETRREACQGEAEAEAGPEAPRPASNHGRWDRQVLSQSPQRGQPDSDFWTHEARDHEFCYFKPPSQSVAVSYSGWKSSN